MECVLRRGRPGSAGGGAVQSCNGLSTPGEYAGPAEEMPGRPTVAGAGPGAGHAALTCRPAPREVAPVLARRRTRTFQGGPGALTWQERHPRPTRQCIPSGGGSRTPGRGGIRFLQWREG